MKTWVLILTVIYAADKEPKQFKIAFDDSMDCARALSQNYRSNIASSAHVGFAAVCAPLDTQSKVKN